MRAVVPIYDNSAEFMIGYTSRSINDKCAMCGTYHYFKHPCPRNKIEESYALKWKHSSGFAAHHHLYNLWNVNSDTVVLVEGTGDVWRAYEAGCHCALGLFGCNISQTQIELLLDKNVQNVVLCLDNDAAGQAASVKIKNQIRLYFNVDIIATDNKDIGDSSVIEVQNILRKAKWNLLV